MSGTIPGFSRDDESMHDEATLPKWAQRRLAVLRHQVAQLSAHVVDEDDLPADVRVRIKRRTRDELTGVVRSTAIPLRDDDTIVMQVTGGEMWIELRKFGARHRVGITGMARWDPIAQDRPDIAILPALGNVVEAGFVMQAPDVVQIPDVLAIEPVRTATDRGGDGRG